MGRRQNVTNFYDFVDACNNNSHILKHVILLTAYALHQYAHPVSFKSGEHMRRREQAFLF